MSPCGLLFSQMPKEMETSAIFKRQDVPVTLTCQLPAASPFPSTQGPAGPPDRSPDPQVSPRGVSTTCSAPSRTQQSSWGHVSITCSATTAVWRRRCGEEQPNQAMTSFCPANRSETFMYDSRFPWGC